jgi:membrane-associated PAP2 superfamily phosphatase
MTGVPARAPTARWPRTLRRDLAVILGGSVLYTALSMLLDLDRRVARAILQPDSPLGALAEDAAAGAFAIAALALVVLAVPFLRRRWPAAARCGAVFAATLLIAVLGLILAMKSEIDRPRPDETIGFGGENPYRHPWGSDPACGCKSFPSSAAGFGFLLAAPYFVLRRRRPGLAWGVLIAGLAAGFLLGYWRMVPGRHWLTDVLWSGAIVLAVASVLSHLAVAWRADA